VYAPFVVAFLCRFQTICCSKSSLTTDLRFQPVNLFDCATVESFCARAGAQRICAMIETVTAVMGLVSAGIFLAHAFEGYRSRA
jgi:hypothetical protein